jgi:peptide/nickel transport system ATP-binding protein
VNVEHHAIDLLSRGRTLVSIADFYYTPGEITFLFGESGIGKSLLCKAVYGLTDPDELQARIDGRPLRNHLDAPLTQAIKRNSFFVFQEPSSHLNPLMRITEQLNEGDLRSSSGEREVLSHFWQTVDEKSIDDILKLYPKPYRPSGGEKQRILLAMAFKKIEVMMRSNIHPAETFFVFDEPTGSLDNHYRNLFLHLLFVKYTQMPFTAMIITHDYSIISEIFSTHRSLAGKVHFKELSRTGDEAVTLHDFSAREYLTWLDLSRPTAGSRSATAPVLDAGSSFRIFDCEHRVFSNAARTQPADLKIHAGEIVYVKAASGVGKTTLAKIIMGLYAPQRFTMTLCGKTLNEKTARRFWPDRIWGRRAGMVFQHADEALDLAAQVKEIFTGLPLKSERDPNALRNRLTDLFDPDELTDAFLRRKVRFLSGGQKQRLNLLRSLALDTDLLILDEPLNGLDFQGVKRVLALLEHRRSQGSAILLISHNEEIFDHMVDPGHVFYLD